MASTLIRPARSAAVIARGIWRRDPSLWARGAAGRREAANRLGWLDSAVALRSELSSLVWFGREVRAAGFTKVFLLGMGGSSLAPEVFRRVFAGSGGLETVVLDTTDPEAIRRAQTGADPARTLFVVSSKSGGTIEVDSLFRHFWSRTGGRGAQFVAITDPGTSLDQLALARGFRRIFRNAPDIGGRFSVLSYFGLVPAVLAGVDAGRLMDQAIEMRRRCGAPGPAGLGPAVEGNPGLELGNALADAALAGRDKVTFVLDWRVAPFGLWLEQLLAESLGKRGKGLVPVAGETLGEPAAYGPDRVFVAMSLGAPWNAETEARLKALERLGHPVIRLHLDDLHALGAEFFRWEFATAVIGARLGVNAFDQPDVQEAKDRTKALLADLAATGTLPEVAPAGPAELRRFLGSFAPGRGYLGVLAFVPYDDALEAPLQELRTALRDRLRVATVFGYGPRYLHSTGQLFKGGPADAGFLIVTCDHPADLAVPGAPYSFGQLERAQALGDLAALAGRRRRAVRLHLTSPDPGAVAALTRLVLAAG